jgi:hypothetical protein
MRMRGKHKVFLTLILVLALTAGLPSTAFAHKKAHKKHPARPALYVCMVEGRVMLAAKPTSTMRDALIQIMTVTGWPANTFNKNINIIKGESGFSINNTNGACDGLWQNLHAVDSYGGMSVKGAYYGTLRMKLTNGKMANVKVWYGNFNQMSAFNPYTNSKAALRKYRKSGWHPWVVAHKLGYCR